MSAKKTLGIWMDHSNAHIMEVTHTNVETKTITSEFTHQVKEDTLGKSEHVMHNKEQHKQAEYYKKLGVVIKQYDEVLLFGPTDAKTELLNSLRDDHQFSNIKIEVKQADKMTENQRHAFAKDYFNKA
jgi:hypothetical protein